MQQELADVVNVVVVYHVVLVHVLGARAVSAEHNSAAAKMVQVVAGDFDSLAVQI